MLFHAPVQVDNPVSMLNQDTSRNFLHSSNPSTKFTLFMRGTHLDQIYKDYTRYAIFAKTRAETINQLVDCRNRFLKNFQLPISVTNIDVTSRYTRLIASGD